MRSRWFNLLAAMSAVLCLASIVLWALSYRWPEHFSRTQLTIADATKTAARTHHLQWNQGLVQFWIQYQMRDNAIKVYTLLGPNGVAYVPKGLLPLNVGPMTPQLARAHWSYSHSDLRWGSLFVEPVSFWNRRGFNAWDSMWYVGGLPPGQEFSAGWQRATTGEKYRAWSIPAWLPTVLFAVLPAVWAYRRGRRCYRERIERKGLCLTCGYDLRASPDRCPECGTAREKTPILE